MRRRVSTGIRVAACARVIAAGSTEDRENLIPRLRRRTQMGRQDLRSLHAIRSRNRSPYLRCSNALSWGSFLCQVKGQPFTPPTSFVCSSVWLPWSHFRRRAARRAGHFAALCYKRAGWTIPRGSNRVNRGGGWENDAANCRTANRNPNDPTNRTNDNGFRLALNSARGRRSDRLAATASLEGPPTGAIKRGDIPPNTFRG